MSLPRFFIPAYQPGNESIILSEETSRHIVQVLRMGSGAQLQLTDGRGHLLTASIDEAHKKHCTVRVEHSDWQPATGRAVTIAISLLKNVNRFEWFLEKATEIGVRKIIPLRCERTEKEKFRADRMESILISAMLQSQQRWLPVMSEPLEFSSIETWQINEGARFIAHCAEGKRTSLYDAGKPGAAMICIGPEGDFTAGEIELALQHSFLPVTLGETRLRTETAGVVAATLLCQG